MPSIIKFHLARSTWQLPIAPTPKSIVSVICIFPLTWGWTSNMIYNLPNFAPAWAILKKLNWNLWWVNECHGRLIWDDCDFFFLVLLGTMNFSWLFYISFIYLFIFTKRLFHISFMFERERLWTHPISYSILQHTKMVNCERL